MVFPDIYDHYLSVFFHHNYIKRKRPLAICCSCKHQSRIILFVYVSFAVRVPSHSSSLKLGNYLIGI